MSRRWTEQELATLDYMHSTGERYGKIAEAIGRSTTAVVQKARQRGLPARWIPWSESEVADCLRWYASGWTANEIANATDRTEMAVSVMLAKHGARRNRWPKEDLDVLMRLGPKGAANKLGRTLDACWSKYRREKRCRSAPK